MFSLACLSSRAYQKKQNKKKFVQIGQKLTDLRAKTCLENTPSFQIIVQGGITVHSGKFSKL